LDFIIAMALRGIGRNDSRHRLVRIAEGGLAKREFWFECRTRLA